MTVFHVRPDHMQDSLAELSVCDFSMSDPAVYRTCWQRRGQVVTVFHVRPNCLQDLLAEKGPGCDCFPCQTQLSAGPAGREGAGVRPLVTVCHAQPALSAGLG